MKHSKSNVISLLVIFVALAGLSYVLPVDEEKRFIHSVYFWLEDDVTEEQKAEFINLCRDLGDIEGVSACYVGPPAGTPRQVVDNTYDIGLIVHMKDREGHDAYQNDPLHEKFLGTCKPWIRDVRIYDVILE